MGSEFAEIDGIEWENVARKFFYECLASFSLSSSISSLSSFSSTTSRVSVRTLVDYIRENASGNYRNESLLDELQKTIEEVSWDGQVNYQLFKKASQRWIARIQRRRCIQNDNNNTPKDDSRSDDEKQNSMDSNDNETAFEHHSKLCRKSKTPRRCVTADFVDLLNVSSYSPSSDTTNGCAMSDSTADDTDSGCGVAGGVPGDLSQLDLRLRVRRFDEENALLREEIVRAEENAAGLQRQLENLRRMLERTREKCRQLEYENDEHQEILNEAEKKERDCRLALQKVEKERGLLARKLEDAETDRQQVTALNAKLECCKKEKFKFMKEATVCRWELEEKQREYELLKDQLAQMTEANKNLEESYNKTIQCLREKIQEMKNENFLLQTLDTGNLPDRLCSTPPVGYFHPHKESTPRDNSSVTMQDSLYDELKASGFSMTNESRVRELEDDLCWYNEEIVHAVNKINDIIEQICHKRSTPHIPELHLDGSNNVKTSEISTLFRKISALSNTVNAINWKPKVKDASSQLCVDSQYTNDQLTRQFGIFNFEHHLDFLSEKSEDKAARREVTNVARERDVFLEAFSMNSRLLGEYVEEVEIAAVADDCHETADTLFSPSCKKSLSAPLRIQEDIILKPIVQELDRIIECTNNNQCEEESTLNSSPSKNPRYRCIYTCAQPSHEQRTSEESKTDSILNSTKGVHCDLAATYVVSSSGDGFPSRMVNHTSANGENKLKVDRTKVTSSCLTSKNLRNIPKRKISVFHRSFDIDTTQTNGEAGVSDAYRLTERSMSTPDEQDKTVEDKMELDPECMKMTPNTRKFLLSYRTNDNESDSSDSLSPLKSLEINRESPSTPEVPIQTNSRPIILVPTKLKLPFLKEIPPYGGNEKNSTQSDERDNEKIKILDDKKVNDNNHEIDSTINENRENHEFTNAEAGKEISAFTGTSSTIEMIRPGDEIERGVTYRKNSISRELNFSDYSLVSPLDNTSIDNELATELKLESVSKVVFSSEGESTSCDSSPKREPPRFQATLKIPLLSTQEKPQITDRDYARQDPSKYRGPWLDSGMEAGCEYQTRNDSANVVSCYSGGGELASGRTRAAQNEKANDVPAVALAMSSGEDSSDSECDPMAIQRDEDDDRRCNETRSISPNLMPFVDGALLGTSTPAPTTTMNNIVNSNERDNCRGTRNFVVQKRDKREKLHTIRRSLSESGCGRFKCCHLNNGNSTQQEFEKEETRPTVFPSLSDVRLQESGIANLANSNEFGGNLSEADLERKYTALSVGLVTDRVTLPRRMALSIRQRDQSERNLVCEFQKMQQDIQDLAPLCVDRESVERVERVRHQLEMITQCAHRVSCTAETLGAVHQEHRVSRAILLADRYLLVLRSRCEKLASDLAETKRILMENNIVIEENNGELGDDMPRIRYRGMPTNNRTMMARRRASIATIFRPLGNFQDVTKDGLRQRNSVSGRVTLRRPSLSAESQKWEAEKLYRTDSSSSIGELREIFEQAESRRNSREENNNNVLRLHSSNLSIRDCENNEIDVWTNARTEEIVSELSVNVDGSHESHHGRISISCWPPNTHLPWRIVVLCTIISFFFGFFVQQAFSSVNQCSGRYFKWWSIEEILGRYFPVKNNSPRPI